MPTDDGGQGQITVDRTMYLIHRVRVATADAVSEMLSDLKLYGTLTLILETLEEMGEASAAELARRTLVTRQALTDPLNELQRRNLIDRPAPSANARVRPVALTEQGRALTAAVRERMRLIESAASEGLAPEELDTLRDLLARYAVGWERLAVDRSRLAAIAADAAPALP